MIIFQSSYSYRHLFKHIIQSYLPTTIVVIISWLSFMIPPASFPGRSGLLSLLILCIMNIMLNIIGQSPLISGICGLTIWCIICLFMVTLFQIIHDLSFWNIQKVNIQRLNLNYLRISFFRYLWHYWSTQPFFFEWDSISQRRSFYYQQKNLQVIMKI